MTYHGKEMDTIHPEGCKQLTWEDAERMEKRNADHSWGFGMADCLHMLAKHMDANEAINNDNPNADSAVLEMEKIEWRLEDANFHTFNKFLHDREYVKAYAWIGKTYTDLEMEVG